MCALYFTEGSADGLGIIYIIYEYTVLGVKRSLPTGSSSTSTTIISIIVCMMITDLDYSRY